VEIRPHLDTTLPVASAFVRVVVVVAIALATRIRQAVALPVLEVSVTIATLPRIPVLVVVEKVMMGAETWVALEWAVQILAERRTTALVGVAQLQARAMIRVLPVYLDRTCLYS